MQAPAHAEGDGHAHAAEAEAKAAEAETKSVEAGRQENLTSFGAGHDAAAFVSCSLWFVASFNPFFSIEIRGSCLCCWLNQQVSTPVPVPGRLHRAPRKSSGEVQAIQVDEPKVEQVEGTQVEKEMAKPEMEPLEEKQDLKEQPQAIASGENLEELEKLEEIHDAESEQVKTVKTKLPVDHDETNKTLEKAPEDGPKNSPIPAVRVWEPDTFDQDVDELKKRFQKASQQKADASKPREPPQLPDPPVVNTTSAARSDASRLDATQVVDLPGSTVELGGTGDAKGSDDPPMDLPVDLPVDPAVDPLATAVAPTASTTTSVELSAMPVEAEVGGAVGWGLAV